jgi:hypothetical protein
LSVALLKSRSLWAAQFETSHLELAVVHLNTAVHHRQAYPGPAVLRSVVQIENLSETIRRNADPRILHPNLDLVAGGWRRNQPQRAAMRHSLTAVDCQVEKRLPEHRRVTVDAGQRHRGVYRHLDVVGLRLGLDQRLDLLEQRANAHRLELQIFGPREFQKSLNHLVQTTNGTLDHFDVLEAALDGRIRCLFRSSQAESNA